MSYHGTQEPANDACMTKRELYFDRNLIVRVRAYLDSALAARLFEENPNRHRPCRGGPAGGWSKIDVHRDQP